MRGIYAFFGVDHKCGTSMLCQSAGELIARARPDWKVLVIHTEEDSGTYYTTGSQESFDRLRPELAEGLLDVHDVAARSRCRGNLHFISGADPLNGDGKYHPNHSDHLLKHLRECFDLILCDSGSHIGHGLALGSLFAAHGIFLVMLQAESSVRRFERLIPLYRKLNVSTIGCLVNRYREHNPFSLSYIRERLDGFEQPFYTVRESPQGLLAETEGRCLIHYRDRSFESDIRCAANLILNDMNAEPIVERVKDPWNLARFRNISKAGP
jgi:hypothetical protein